MNIGIILAGGIGSRMSLSMPKQFYEFDGKPLILYALESFQSSSLVTDILVVCIDGWKQKLEDIAQKNNITKLNWIVNGGKTHQQSLTNALFFLKDYCNKEDIVIIHNANRPMVTVDIIEDSIETCKKYGCGVSSISCVDTVMYSDNFKYSTKFLDREKIFRTQSPQSYFFCDLFEVYQKAFNEGLRNKYECELMTRYGKKIFFSKGSEKNIKITTPDDIFYLYTFNNEKTKK